MPYIEDCDCEACKVLRRRRDIDKALDQVYSGTVQTQKSGKNLKPRYDLVPAEGLRAAARAMGAGSAKYGNEVQRKTVDEHYRGILSHLTAWRLGETADAETGLHPLDHAMARMALLVYEVEALDSDPGAGHT